MNKPLRRLAIVAALLFGSLFISTTYIQFIAPASLEKGPRNSRALYKERGKNRGPIVVGGKAVAESIKVDDEYNYQRKYPIGPLYAHATGAYTVVSDPSGLENAANDLLSGTADQLFFHRLSDLFTGKEPQGATVELTLNAAAQKAAFEALGDQRGAVLAIEPSTGKILAMVSKPSYDPNTLATHDEAKAMEARTKLLALKSHPAVNRAIAGDLYTPGSVFKLVTSAAALSSGKYSPDTTVDGPAQLDLPQTSATLPNEWKGACGNGSGRVTLKRALEESCNTAFGAIGLDLGSEALAEQAGRFGFGRSLRIPMTATPSIFPESPNEPQTAQSAIGQFDVRVTPLQIAMVTAAIANGGVVMQPTLVNSVKEQDTSVISQTEPRQLGAAISADVASQLADMMEGVVTEGTGSNARIDGVRVGGKTGTAEKGLEQAPDVWFTGFAPLDDPQVAVAVVVEDGGDQGKEGSGNGTAAPVARKVIEAVLGR
ncbi:MAG: penicillin-binding protein [Actinomycetota bacterium]|nr:penicillin-binding protein [Actinomycetota bacterium]